ncbi:MAG TPA: sulfurtransferase [Herpetosiphonaceae bacterium]|nr:sulfurtransferase [Herpetosiphonaceae bacterium]
MSEYVNPDVLVSTAWVAEHLNDPSVRLVESDEDILLYEVGHIPGAVKINWQDDLNDTRIRDYIDGDHFAALMGRFGIASDTTVVFYGDKNNWWACYAYWVFKLMGHENLKVMNGGRKKWIDEGRELTRALPAHATTAYQAGTPHPEIRAFRDDVLEHIGRPNPRQPAIDLPAGRTLVDVRSPDEFTGKKLHMPEYPQEGALRGGHIPGAANIPWGKAVNEDGTFKSADEIKALYEGAGITPDADTVVYCRIGERSSLTWFVLHELMGYAKVRNYDGSWTEWGNLVRAPIVRGEEPGTLA